MYNVVICLSHVAHLYQKIAVNRLYWLICVVAQLILVR